jgi:hypothetical protein
VGHVVREANVSRTVAGDVKSGDAGKNAARNRGATERRIHHHLLGILEIG